LPILVAGGDGSDGSGERVGLVVGAVVGDHPHDPVDAVGGEERPGTVEEPDRGACGLVGKVLGVGQAGVPVDGGVQVDVADPGTFGLGALGGLVRRGPAVVGAPRAAVGDTADLLCVQVDHVPRIA